MSFNNYIPPAKFDTTVAEMTEQETITEDEAALYDRQIRLWGLDAQRRYNNIFLYFRKSNGNAGHCRVQVDSAISAILPVRQISRHFGTWSFRLQVKWHLVKSAPYNNSQFGTYVHE